MSEARPSILLITFDCLRPDHLGAAGYRGVDTPTLDRMAAEGTLFTNAYCQAPNTWISHASLFTGSNPYRHGVRTPVRRISKAVCTVAESFRAAGYSTFGLPAMYVLSHEAGFARGFDEYRVDELEAGEGTRRYFRSALDTLDATCEWLGRAARPFFAWIHYYGIHKVEGSPLDLPQEYRRQYSEYAQHYDGKVAFADREFLAPLVRRLEGLQLLDDIILILWSDHGEDLRLVEHNSPQWGHNWDLTEGVIRTLLLIRAPGRLPAGERREDIAQSIDVFPTLLEMSAIGSALDQFEGRSLVDPSPRPNVVVYVENLCQGFVGVRRGRFKLIISEQEQQGLPKLGSTLRRRLRPVRKTLRSLAPPKWRHLSLPGHHTQQRYVFTSWWRAKGEPEQILQRLLDRGVYKLYDLLVDAGERCDVSAAHPGVVHQLAQEIRQRAGQAGAFNTAYTAEEEADVEERLRGLGYMD